MDTNHNKVVGERVKELLKSHDKKQAWLAEQLGYSDPNMISMICNGRRTLTQKKALKLVELFPEVSLDWVMGRSDFKSLKEKALYCAIDLSFEIQAQQEAIYKLAKVNGYMVLSPEDYQEFGITPAEARSYGYTISSEDGCFIRLTGEEMGHFRVLVSDFVNLQLQYLFQTKQVFWDNKEDIDNG